MFARALESVNGREEEIKTNFIENLRRYVETLNSALATLAKFGVITTRTHFDFAAQSLHLQKELDNLTAANMQTLFREVRDYKSKLSPILNSALEDARKNFNLADASVMKNPILANTAASLKHKEDLRYPVAVSAAVDLKEKDKKHSLSSKGSLFSPRTNNDIYQITSTYDSLITLKELKLQIENNMINLEHNLINLKQYKNSFYTEKNLKELSTNKTSEGRAAKTILAIMNSKEFKISAENENKIKIIQTMVAKFNKELKGNKDSVLHQYYDQEQTPAETVIQSIKLNLQQIQEIQIAVIQKVLHKNFLKRVEQADIKPDIQTQDVQKNAQINFLLDRAYTKAYAMDNYLKQKSTAIQRNTTFSSLARRTTIFVYHMLNLSTSNVTSSLNKPEKSAMSFKIEENPNSHREHSKSSGLTTSNSETNINDLISGSRKPSISVSETEMKEEDLPNRPRRP